MEWEQNAVRTVAFLLGDGCTGRNSPKQSNEDPALGFVRLQAEGKVLLQMVEKAMLTQTALALLSRGQTRRRKGAQAGGMTRGGEQFRGHHAASQAEVLTSSSGGGKRKQKEVLEAPRVS